MKSAAMTILGIMSGSSLDGLDLAIVRFTDLGSYEWKLETCKHIPFNQKLEHRLRQASHCSGRELWQLHVDFGRFIGQEANILIEAYGQEVDFIASHGHTVFHEPNNHMTCQIGDGASIARTAQVKTICDFRSTDVAHGGQGAPLAPLADKLLFTEYFAFLNLGGIANCSVISEEKIIGFDICPANQILNTIAIEMGFKYDDKGKIARSGSMNQILFDQLNRWSEKHDQSSISNNDIEQYLLPIIKSDTQTSTEDKLHTATKYIAQRITNVFEQLNIQQVFCTGGGTYNEYLLSLLNMNPSDIEFTPADKEIIDYKEAILMALAGLRRQQDLPIFFHTVTGSTKNVSGGCIYLPS